MQHGAVLRTTALLSASPPSGSCKTGLHFNSGMPPDLHFNPELWIARRSDHTVPAPCQPTARSAIVSRLPDPERDRKEEVGRARETQPHGERAKYDNIYCLEPSIAALNLHALGSKVLYDQHFISLGSINASFPTPRPGARPRRMRQRTERERDKCVVIMSLIIDFSYD